MIKLNRGGKMKKTGIILILASILIIGIGIIILLVDNQTDKKPNEDDVIIVDEDLIDQTPMEENEDALKNTNPKIYEEHCYENLCYKITSISYLGEIGMIGINITNKGNKVVNGVFKKLIFKEASNKYESLIYIEDLNPNETIATISQFSKVNIINATDYEVLNPTEKELEELNEIQNKNS